MTGRRKSPPLRPAAPSDGERARALGWEGGEEEQEGRASPARGRAEGPLDVGTGRQPVGSVAGEARATERERRRRAAFGRARSRRGRAFRRRRRDRGRSRRRRRRPIGRAGRLVAGWRWRTVEGAPRVSGRAPPPWRTWRPWAERGGEECCLPARGGVWSLLIRGKKRRAGGECRVRPRAVSARMPKRLLVCDVATMVCLGRPGSASKKADRGANVAREENAHRTPTTEKDGDATGTSCSAPE